jgi:hypothetical protein
VICSRCRRIPRTKDHSTESTSEEEACCPNGNGQDQIRSQEHEACRKEGGAETARCQEGGSWQARFQKGRAEESRAKEGCRFADEA